MTHLSMQAKKRKLVSIYPYAKHDKDSSDVVADMYVLYGMKIRLGHKVRGKILYIM